MLKITIDKSGVFGMSSCVNRLWGTVVIRIKLTQKVVNILQNMLYYQSKYELTDQNQKIGKVGLQSNIHRVNPPDQFVLIPNI